MFAATIYHRLSRLFHECSVLRRRVEQSAAPGEIMLLADAARHTGQELRRILNPDEGLGFDMLDRHLYWIRRWYERGDPSRCQSDVADLFERDLPRIVEHVQEWEEGLMDGGLVSAVSESWQLGRFDHVLRDGFIYLEEQLRRAGTIPPTDPSTGPQLVRRLIDPSSPERIELSAEAFSAVTRGEQKGAASLFSGAFAFFRNPVAHRVTALTPEAADEVLRLINLLLRVLGAGEARVFRITMPAAAATPEVVEALRAILSRHPGDAAVHLHLVAGSEEKVLRLPSRYWVRTTAALRAEVTELLGPGAMTS